MTGKTKSEWSALRPIAVGLFIILVVLGGFFAWAWMATISGAIVASGQIEVEQNRQVVQHPDGGVVAEILVREGQMVDAGQTLIRLDPTLLSSQLSITEGQLFELMARRARLEAERDQRDQITFDPDLAVLAKTNQDVAELMDGQRQLFEARRVTRQKERETLSNRIFQIESQIRGIVAQQAALDEQLSLIQEELEDQQSLLDRGLAQSSRVLALRREAAALAGQLAELAASEASAKERISEIEIELLKLDTDRQEEAITRLRDLQYNEFEQAENRLALREQLSRLDLKAPVSGVIYGLTVFTTRAVIRPADPVLYIVPQDRPLVIAAKVEPIHVDQVFAGQDVILRFPAFDSRTTPELEGRVTKVSADAFTDERSQLTYYRAEVEISENQLDLLPEGLVLIPGMPVETYLRTSDRSPIAYLTKPLTDYFNRAFREG
ncbi:HlyD family type I secretion periplasmic adaptor subunit [Aliiroseovarius sp. PTFE2010]|uniref:HlyD family type I secretion periplasmic adaptor subunit n=1 Tax=Aliiroseovarius sp. PTFE2010 TaxID=3417190 RepID=UPI003CE9E48B